MLEVLEEQVQKVAMETLQFLDQLHQLVVEQAEHILVVDLEIQEDLVVEVVQEIPEEDLEDQEIHLL